MHEIVQSALKLAPSIKSILGGDYGVYVTDLEKYLCCDHGVLKLNLNVGDIVKPVSVMGKSIDQNNRVLTKVDSELFGVPYMASSNPLHDDSGRVVGGLAIVFPARIEIIKTSTELIDSNTLDISAATQELSASAEQFSATTQELSTQIMQISTSVQVYKQQIKLLNLFKVSQNALIFLV